MLLAEKYAAADFNAVRSYERKEGQTEKGIAVYNNLIKRGFTKEEALSIAEIPESALEVEKSGD